MKEFGKIALIAFAVIVIDNMVGLSAKIAPKKA